jgi:hypothetical protein
MVGGFSIPTTNHADCSATPGPLSRGLNPQRNHLSCRGSRAPRSGDYVKEAARDQGADVLIAFPDRLHRRFQPGGSVYHARAGQHPEASIKTVIFRQFVSGRRRFTVAVDDVRWQYRRRSRARYPVSAVPRGWIRRREYVVRGDAAVVRYECSRCEHAWQRAH